MDVSINEEEQDGAKSETIKTELYLIDKYGYVVPITMDLPKTESVAKQALEYLKVEGPVTELLPNDFRAVLPSDTQFTINIEDGTATVDFSKEFAEYSPEDEMKILQSITWTLTQCDAIDRVKLQMAGHDLKEMPVNGTPIQGELTRKNGINIDKEQVVDITNTYPLTIYYIAQTDHESYYVPVTKRVDNETENIAQAIVNELIKGPGITSPLFTLFMPDVELVSEPVIKDGVVTLNFNENIYGSYEQKLVTEQVIDTLVLSLTEQEGIKGVAIEVNGEKNIVDQNGKALSEPVTRPEKINTGSY